DLLADDGVAVVELALDHALLDGVGILDGDVAFAVGERIDRGAVDQRVVQLVAVLGDSGFVHVLLWSMVRAGEAEGRTGRVAPSRSGSQYLIITLRSSV